LKSVALFSSLNRAIRVAARDYFCANDLRFEAYIESQQIEQGPEGSELSLRLLIAMCKPKFEL
jgi:hypothetical protein